MLGHDFVLSETNTHGWVFVCECGEIGNVHEHAGWSSAGRAARRDVAELVRARATIEHGKHLDAVRESTAAAHAVALDQHAGYLAAVTPTLKRVGRWGNG